ncbi:MAG: hypothetical protein AAF410_02765 [Pseudomonadota bacterium]
MRIFLFGIIFAAMCSAYANEADVIAAEAQAIGGDFYRINVTVMHKDQGWDHYVKGWQVLDLEGNVLGVHGLRHPHVNEQPFTRSTTMIIPAKIDKVKIRAIDSLHETGGNELLLYINKEKPNETD